MHVCMYVFIFFTNPHLFLRVRPLPPPSWGKSAGRGGIGVADFRHQIVKRGRGAVDAVEGGEGGVKERRRERTLRRDGEESGPAVDVGLHGRRASRTVIAIGIEGAAAGAAGRADVKGEAQSPLQQDSEVGVVQGVFVGRWRRGKGDGGVRPRLGQKQCALVGKSASN